jgi:hypothetical protein
MQTHVIELTEDPIITPQYSILAQVQDNDTNNEELVTFWVIAASENGFVGIEYGKEKELNLNAIPGQLWENVITLGSTTNPEEDNPTTVAFKKIYELWVENK